MEKQVENDSLQRIAHAAVEHGLVEITDQDIEAFIQFPSQFDPLTQSIISLHVNRIDRLG